MLAREVRCRGLRRFVGLKAGALTRCRPRSRRPGRMRRGPRGDGLVDGGGGGLRWLSPQPIAGRFCLSIAMPGRDPARPHGGVARGAWPGFWRRPSRSMEALGARRGDIVAGARPHHQRGRITRSAPSSSRPSARPIPPMSVSFTPNAGGRAQFDLPGFHRRPARRRPASPPSRISPAAPMRKSRALPLLPPPHPPPGAGPRAADLGRSALPG